MKTFNLLLSVLLLLSACVSQDVVHHPAPKEPVFIASVLYPELKKALIPPPGKDTPQQKKDEELLLEAQTSRTEIDCNRAKSEVFVSLETFFGPTYGLFDVTTIEKLAPFFEQLRNDGDYFIQKLKVDFPRQRPFLYMEKIQPCVPKEVTGAYPSGHATLARLYSLVLANLYPKLKSKLEKRGNEIAQDRVLSGMHHPSDIENGKLVGTWLFEQFMKSTKFKADLEALRKQLSPKK